MARAGIDEYSEKNDKGSEKHEDSEKKDEKEDEKTDKKTDKKTDGKDGKKDGKKDEDSKEPGDYVLELFHLHEADEAEKKPEKTQAEEKELKPEGTAAKPEEGKTKPEDETEAEVKKTCPFKKHKHYRIVVREVGQKMSKWIGSRYMLMNSQEVTESQSANPAEDGEPPNTNLLEQRS
ncbi:hypothetical protein C8Q78DRAFT_993234 [Trametes maxima]|nr:hypothetical protein C8Q78DRAFT_993234 [Trametes maxima]